MKCLKSTWHTVYHRLSMTRTYIPLESYPNFFYSMVFESESLSFIYRSAKWQNHLVVLYINAMVTAKGLRIRALTYTNKRALLIVRFVLCEAVRIWAYFASQKVLLKTNAHFTSHNIKHGGSTNNVSTSFIKPQLATGGWASLSKGQLTRSPLWAPQSSSGETCH